MKIAIFLAGFWCMLAACNSNKAKQAPTDLQSLSWLEGRWKCTSDLSPYVDSLSFEERWEKVSDSVLVGVILKIRGEQREAIETIRIAVTDHGLNYSVVVPGKYKSGYYELKGAADSAGLFRNPRHEFPYRVWYQKITADSAVLHTVDPPGGEIHLKEYLKRISEKEHR